MSNNIQEHGVITSFLRVGMGEDDPMRADFEFLEVSCAMLVDPGTGEVHVHRVKKNDELGAELAQGRLQRVDAETEKHPNLKGVFRTAKGSWFETSGWEHSDPVMEEKYFALRIRPYTRRKGKSL